MTEPLPYHLPVYNTIAKAWEKIRGAKATIWAALVVSILITFGIGFVSGLVQDHFPYLSKTINFVGQVINFLLQLGILYIGIRRAFDLPISYKMMFHTLKMNISLYAIGLYLLQTIILIPALILIAIGAVIYSISTVMAIIGSLLCLIGMLTMIYLAIRMSMSMACVLDKLMSPLAAIKLSFKITRGNIGRLIGVSILQFLILLISIIPLGIGLIWSLPFVFILYGMLYKNLTLNTPH